MILVFALLAACGSAQPPALEQEVPQPSHEPSVRSPSLAPAADPATERAASLMNKYSGQVEHCYLAALRGDPALGGVLTVQVHIEQGQVSSAVLLRSSLPAGSGVEDCALRKIQRWSFPEQMSVQLDYSFSLEPGMMEDAAP